MSRKEARVVAVLGLPICNVSMQEAVASIDGRVRSGSYHQIATANLDFVNNARENEELHRVICDCSMVLPDGFPLLWASKLLGRPLKQRVTGVDLTPELAKLSAAKGYGIFLLGSTDENAQAAMRVMQEQHPGVRFVGQYAPPPASLDKMDNDEIIRRVHEAKPDILLVAFGNPKQELWIHRHRESLKVPVSIGIGGTLEMIAGVKRRAPRAVQMLRMEWMFRMLQEPRRLLPRYAKDFRSLLRYLPRDLMAERMQPRGEEVGELRHTVRDGGKVITIHRVLTGTVCQQLRDYISDCIRSGESAIVDLSEVTRVQADGVGCLLDLRRSLAKRHLALSLVNVTPSVARVLSAASLSEILTGQMTQPAVVKSAEALELRAS